MVVTLDELSTEDQKLFGELYDEKGRRIQWCKWCGVWGIYLAHSDQVTTTLHYIEDNSVHTCHNLSAVRGYYQRENL
jgi:hypothetical protein